MKCGFRINHFAYPMRLFFSLLILLTLASAQSVVLVRFNEAETYWKQNHGDTLLVVNFWATWCKPCVTELPCFEALNTEKFSRPVKVLLMNLDYTQDLKERVMPIIKKKNIQSQVWLMNEPNPNTWIDRVSPAWSGAIPATLFVKPEGSYALFQEKSYTCPELKSLVQRLSE